MEIPPGLLLSEQARSRKLRESRGEKR